MRHTRSLPILLACAVFGTGAPAAAQNVDVPRFVIHGKDGPLPAAELSRLSTTWTLERAGKKDAIAATDWIGLQQADRARPAPPADHFVLLGSGDRLPIKPGGAVRLQDGRLLFSPAEPLRALSGTELALFRPYVAMVLLAVPDGVDDVEQFVARLQRDPRENDIVLLRNGDRIEGAVDSLSEAAGCEVMADGQKIVTPWAKLAGVALATANQARPRPKKLHGSAVLANGARLHFAALHLDAPARQWSGKSTTGVEVAFPDQALVALDLLQGRALYLSEVPPFGYKHFGYLGVFWPPLMDTAADGQRLRVGDDYFDKGIGVHGRCRVTYWLDGQFSAFEATAGLDPSAGSKARARLAVIVDGKRHPLGEDRELTPDDPPLPVRLDLRGARSMTLAVDHGSLGDVQARVNWGNARLIRLKN